MPDWFRAYNEALDDPKIQRLPGELFKTWFNLLCIASRCDGGLPELRDLAFMLRLPEDEAGHRVAELIEAGLLDREGETLRPHNWDGRQYKSDSSTPRVQKFRRGKPGGGVKRFIAVSETPPETETETEADISSAAMRGSAREGPPETDLSVARPLGKDLLEAEARTLMDGIPVMVDPDFSPISGLLGEPGVERGDVLVGLTEARDAPTFRPVSWRQCAGWVRRAARNRLSAAAGELRSRAPPGRADASRSTKLTSASLSRMAQDGFDFSTLDASPDAWNSSAYGGPIIEGDPRPHARRA